MADQSHLKAQEQFIEQKITQRVTVNAGATGEVTLNIPASCKAFLKGYGYTWYSSNTFQLTAGKLTFPTRTDQEGSTSIPVIYGNPYPVFSGETIRLQIINASADNNIYDVVFYVLSTRILQVNSTGGELLLSTSSPSGSSTFSVSITSPSTLLAGSKTTSGAAAVALASSASCQRVTIQADVGNADPVLVGNSSSQLISLDGGQSMDIYIADISSIYIKRSGSNNVTVNYLGA